MDVQSGAGAEIERLQAHIDRLGELASRSCPWSLKKKKKKKKLYEKKERRGHHSSSSAYTEVDTLEELDVAKEQEHEQDIVEEVVEEKKQQLENLSRRPPCQTLSFP